MVADEDGGTGVGNPTVVATEPLSPKATLPIREHELYKLLLRTRDYLESASESAYVNSRELPQLINEFVREQGVDLNQRLLGIITQPEAKSFVSGNLKLDTTQAAIQVIEEIALMRQAQAAGSSDRIVRIEKPEIRSIVPDVIRSLTDLEKCLQQSNEAGSEGSAITDFQRQVLIAALKAMIAQLEGPVVDRQQVGELADTLDSVVKEGVKKGISNTVKDLVVGAKDQLFGLGDKLSTIDLDTWNSIGDIFPKG